MSYEYEEEYFAAQTRYEQEERRLEYLADLEKSKTDEFYIDDDQRLWERFDNFYNEDKDMHLWIEYWTKYEEVYGHGQEDKSSTTEQDEG